MQSETDKKFCHFRPLFALLPTLMILKIKILKKWEKSLEILFFYTYMCTINEDHMIYGFWNKRHNRQIFCNFGPIFSPFTLPPPPSPPNKLTSQTFEKMKKASRNIILQMYAINDNHINYGSWDMEC